MLARFFFVQASDLYKTTDAQPHAIDWSDGPAVLGVSARR